MNMWMSSLEQVLITAQAAAPGAPADAGNFFRQMQPIVMMGLMLVVLYFLMIRPQMKQQKEHRKLVEAVKSGDKVVAAGGIYGIISNVKDKTVILKVADNVKFEVDKASITVVMKDTDAGQAS